MNAKNDGFGKCISFQIWKLFSKEPVCSIKTKKRATTSFFKIDICVFVLWCDGTNTLDLRKLGGWNKMTKDSIWDRFEASLMSNFPMHPYVKSV